MTEETKATNDKPWRERSANEIEPGIYNLSMEDYHSGPGVSKSDLVWILHHTPFHLWHRKNHPELYEFKWSPIMLLGSVAHKLLLEPDQFSEEFIVMPNIETVPSPSRKGVKKEDAEKASAERFAKARTDADKLAAFGNSKMLPPELKLKYTNTQVGAFKAQLEIRAEQLKKKLIDSEMFEQATAIHNSGIANKRVAQLLSNGQPERSILWRDADTGILCKSRPDYMRQLKRKDSPDFWCISDIKTTGSASPLDEPGTFVRIAHGLDYHVQDAMMRDGLNTISGEGSAIVVFIAIERNQPYAFATYTLEDDAVELGRENYKRALSIYAECLKTGEWPCYSQKLITIKYPKYAYYKK